MYNYKITYKGQNCHAYKIVPTRRPSVPAPQPRYEQITVPGRDSALIDSDGCMDPITIPVEFNFLSRPEEWAQTFRIAKRWLTGSGKLHMSDDPEYYYRCLMCAITDSERTAVRIGTFTAEFLCDPYMYMVIGDKPVSDYATLYNPLDLCHPEYILSGSGSATLTINGAQIRATVNGTLTIDTDLMIAYNADKENQSNMISGNYEDMYLNSGKNTISISGATLQVVPHWRTL